MITTEPRMTAQRPIVIALICLSFAVSWLVGVTLFEARAIVQLDVWFQADPDDFFIQRFSDLFRHPNIGVFVGVPTTLAGRALGILGIGTAAPDQMQHWLMLLVAPVAGAVRTMAAFQALRRLTGSLGLVILLCLLDIAAFGMVALGSVPESFPLTAAALALLYWLLIADASGPRVRWLWWIVVGTFAAGVTLSNLASFSILLGTLLLLRGLRIPRIVAQTGAIAGAVLALTVLLAVSTALVSGRSLRDRVDRSTSRFIRASPTSSVISELTLAMAHTFVAPLATPAPGAEPPATNPDYDLQLLLPTSFREGSADWWRGALTVLVLALGVAGYLRRRATAVWLLPAVAILASNFTLHLFYGHHYFLYTLHWLFSMVWIIAGVAFLTGRVRTAAVVAVGLFLMVTAVNSAVVVRQLFSFLRAV